MRASTLLLCCGLAVAAGEAALGVVLRDTVLGPYFWACAAATAVLAVVLRRFLEAPGEGGDDPGGQADPEGPPPWWPEFESQFEAHVRASDRVQV